MKQVSLAVLILALVWSVKAQPSKQKTEAWRDLKYSMFIHYGIYSVLGGVWEGKQIERGLSEQIQAHAGIYSDTYAAVAKQFNPTQWNADSVAALAKSAGMRSIVITSKHHDGFCLFQSDYTDFDVVDATPFKRDVIKELSSACSRYGLKFGLYFSLIDWHYPQASPISSHNSDFITPEHHAYNKKQVTELLTRYGVISELWFDMGSQSLQQSKELSELVHQLQPDCQVSSRIGNDQGDFMVMGDNQEPAYIIGVPWQSPASFFDETWGYRSWQKRGSEKDKVKEKLSSLIRVVSRGGNYLLNIGPKGDGGVVDFEKNVLLAMGKWLTKNSEAIYGTRPDPFQVNFGWGNITTSADGTKLYLHILSTPPQGIIDLPGLKGTIKQAYVLDDKMVAGFSERDDKVRITLPESFKIDEEFKVVVIDFKNKFSVRPANLLHPRDGRFTLTYETSFKHYSNSCIDYNTRFRSTVEQAWFLSQHRRPSLFTPVLYYTDGEVGKDIVVSIRDHDEVIHLTSKETINFKQDASTLAWGPVYKAGPFSSSLDEIHGNISEINVHEPWPSETDNSWEQQAQWQGGKLNSFPADAMTCYYFLEEITSTVDQPVIIQVASGDGVVVFLNGQEQLIQLNQQREKNAEHAILLQLKRGKNQLLVKSFNNFRKEIVCSIGIHSNQLSYMQKLKPIMLGGEVSPVSLRLHKPNTPHQHMMMQNVSIELIGEDK
jgi:alpha-L-fucosidase